MKANALVVALMSCGMASIQAADIPCPQDNATAPAETLHLKAGPPPAGMMKTQYGATSSQKLELPTGSSSLLPGITIPTAVGQKPLVYQLPGSITFNTSALPHIKPAPDPKINLAIGSLVRKYSPERQLDPTDATIEARLNTPLTLTSAEKARQAVNATCSTAFKNLVTTFDLNRQALGISPKYDLGDFFAWYFQSTLSPALRSKAAPVVDAQRAYEQACLQQPIPPEMSPSAVHRAVGVLMYDGKVFCTALRTSATEIVTAQHCFIDALTGKRNSDVQSFLSGTGTMWFAYEAEPKNRYGVCRGSIPPARTSGSYAPARDVARLQIAPTTAPVPQIVKSGAPIADGTPLYIRGYFPFTDPNLAPLDRMRSTKVGGCFAHAVAGNCFFHACQTTPLMSGAPVFVRPEAAGGSDRLVLAGMHLGGALLSNPAGETGAVCKGADGRKVPSGNFAYQFQ